MKDSSNRSSIESKHSITTPDENPTVLNLHLFEAVGIELEYMIVDQQSLDVNPICDRLLQAQAGEITTEVAFDDVSWSNELALHVAELKTTLPAKDLRMSSGMFHEHVLRMNTLLGPMDSRLMPTAMHPWMNPDEQMRLWPHENSPIYEAFNRIFDCRGHGWANLQSAHINLPFLGDEEFGRLHAAIRLALPLIPALAASSPIVDSRRTQLLDNRLQMYRHNCDRLPMLVGPVIPEAVFSIEQYHEQILNKVYDSLRPHDPQGVLLYEWSNARGAIARFERNTIEIRLIDVQECPAADLAIVSFLVCLIQALCKEAWCDAESQQEITTEALVTVLNDAIRDGQQAIVRDEAYLRVLGRADAAPCTVRDLLPSLIGRAHRAAEDRFIAETKVLDHIVQQGPLAKRMLHHLPQVPSREELHTLYGQLCRSLVENRPFDA